VTTQLDEQGAASAAQALTHTMTTTTDGSQLGALASGLQAVTEATQRSPGRFTPQQLTDMLKWPTCVGPAREVVLLSLGQRFGRRFADPCEFADWARQHRPDLNLGSPPERSGNFTSSL
jgi:hypothetical protein